jgi:hypothetical protein
MSGYFLNNKKNFKRFMTQSPEQEAVLHIFEQIKNNPLDSQDFNQHI